MDSSMHRKHVFITGGNGGLGLELAASFSKNGYLVSISDTHINESKYNQFVCDISDATQFERCLFEAIHDNGNIDVLINCAGISLKQKNGDKISLFEVEYEQYRKVFDVNVWGVINCSKQVARHMIQNGCQGSIINIGSIMGIRGSSDFTDEFSYPASNSSIDYSASKAAVHNLTKSFAKELAQHQVRVNCIAPGAVNGGMLTTKHPIIGRVIQQTPLKQLSDPKVIAELSLFLADNQRSQGITGQVYNVCGGWSC